MFFIKLYDTKAGTRDGMGFPSVFVGSFAVEFTDRAYVVRQHGKEHRFPVQSWNDSEYGRFIKRLEAK